jgi:PleD family two-component response regulator
MRCQALAVRAAPDGSATRLVGSLTDVTAQRELEEKLRYGAHHDALTGLPNRTLFLDRLTQALARSRRNPEARIALLFLDLDGFKQVNDNLGHLAGDQLLVEVAVRIGQRLRQSDTAARLGGGRPGARGGGCDRGRHLPPPLRAVRDRR